LKKKRARAKEKILLINKEPVYIIGIDRVKEEKIKHFLFIEC
jgi:hypothetical protein